MATTSEQKPINTNDELFMLLSGANVGPEGPLGILVQDIAVWMSEKLKVAKEQAKNQESIFPDPHQDTETRKGKPGKGQKS